MQPKQALSTAVLFLACAAAQRFADFPADTLYVRPPAIPLFVVDQFFSLWMPADNLTDTYTAHWTLVFDGNGWKAASSVALIDGQPYRLLGPCPAGVPPLQQVGPARVYGYSTLVRYAGAGISLNLTFTQPLSDSGSAPVEHNQAPFSYVTYDVASTDGRPHAVKLFFDASAQLAVNTDMEAVVWQRFNLSGAPQGSASMRIGTAAQNYFSGYGDNFRIDWGYLHVAAPPVSGAGMRLASAMASSNLMRTTFLASGNSSTAPLLPPDETVMPLPACTNSAGQAICGCETPGGSGSANDWPSLGVAWDLGGTVTADGAISSVAAVVAYDDVKSIRFFGHDQPAYWRVNGRTTDQLLSAVLTQYDAIMDLAIRRDLEMVTQLRATGLGEAFERMCSLSFRQTFADNKLVFYNGSFGGPTQPGLHMWVKGQASSGDTGTMDDNYPAVPLFLLTQPQFIEAFLAPLFMWARNETTSQQPGAPFPLNMTYDYPFAPHYLGQHPDAELQCWDTSSPMNECEPMPIEMTADAITLIAAVAQQTGDVSFAESYWGLLQPWAAYLVQEGLYPNNQRSTDDYEGFIVNSTHLAAKAIIGLGAYSLLCNATGRPAEGAAAWATAQQYRDTWMGLALDPSGQYTMLTYAQPGSYSIKYSLLFDVGLGLNLFAAILPMECAHLQANVQPYGWVLQHANGSANTWTNLGWEGWWAALCGPDTATDAFARMVAYVNAVDRRVPLSDWFDAATAKFQGFTARAQVGGLFAPLWLQQIQARRAGGGEWRGPH